MDFKAFQKLTCGLYIVSTNDKGQNVGCVVNTVTQVTAMPAQVMVAIHKDNTTAQVLQQTGVFHATALTEEAPLPLIGVFGYRSSKEIDKFAEFETLTDSNGCPYTTVGAAAHFTCKVVQQCDVGTHILFIGAVEDAQVVSEDTPMSYSYYHTVKKGMTPPRASSYQPPES